MATEQNIEWRTIDDDGNEYIIYPKTKIENIIDINELKLPSSTTYTVPVTATWTADSTNGGYVQSVSVPGILESDNPIADIVLGEDISANDLYLDAWSLITRITTEDDNITLWANKNAPTTSFTVQLKVVR